MKNSTHQNNRLFSALKHAISAGVLITLSTAGTAQMQPEIGRNQDVAHSIGIAKSAYPSNQKLFDLYQAMVKSGDVAEATVPPTENDEAFLQRNFDFAVKSGLIDKYTKLLAQPAQVAKASTVLCLGEIFGCSAGLLGETLGCLGAIGGATTAASAAGGPPAGALSAQTIGAFCAGIIGSTAGACGAALANSCAGVGEDPPAWHIPQHTTDKAGFEVSAGKEDFCNAGMKVKGLEGFWFTRDGLRKFGKVRAVCTDNEQMDFGVNEGGTSASKRTETCPAGFMMAAIYVTNASASGHVTSITPVCDRVGQSGGSGDNVKLTTLGTEAGGSTLLACPEHTYIFGIKAYRSRDTTSKSVINSIRVHCK